MDEDDMEYCTTTAMVTTIGKCEMCDLHASVDPQHQGIAAMIETYIADHIHKCNVDRIAFDIQAVLQSELDMDVPIETILLHVRRHSTNATVIMTTVVRDLSQLAQVAKQSSIVRCLETDKELINPKALAMYLRTTQELQTALRHEALKNTKPTNTDSHR